MKGRLRSRLDRLEQRQTAVSQQQVPPWFWGWLNGSFIPTQEEWGDMPEWIVEALQTKPDPDEVEREIERLLAQGQGAPDSNGTNGRLPPPSTNGDYQE